MKALASFGRGDAACSLFTKTRPHRHTDLINATQTQISLKFNNTPQTKQTHTQQTAATLWRSLYASCYLGSVNS